MECGSCSDGAGASGALNMQANLAMKVYASGAQTPQPASVDSAARTAGLQAEGKGQKLDAVC